MHCCKCRDLAATITPDELVLVAGTVICKRCSKRGGYEFDRLHVVGPAQIRFHDQPNTST